MEIPSYLFQSPYPSAIQVGRPDPQANAQEEQNTAVDAMAQAGNETLAEAKGYQVQNLSSSVNVAVSSSYSAVSESLDAFSTLNSQLQGIEAYTSEQGLF